MLVVKKFGGTSLADAAKLRKAAEICAISYKKGIKTAVVVSARGGSTDELEDIAHSICRVLPARERDALLATGEIQSAALMAMQLIALGLPACSLTGRQAGVLTDKNYGHAGIIKLEPARVRALLNAGFIPVVCGFQGADEGGNITTIGRGGSDTSAVALAAALGADKCEIYTDVDGIYTADPRIVPHARHLDEIDFASMLTLSENGAQVLHPKSVKLAKESGIRLLVLHSSGESSGTEVKELPVPLPFAGAACSRADSTVTAVGSALNDDTMEQIINALSDSGIAVKLAICSDPYIKITTAPEKLTEAVKIIHDLCLTL